MPARFIALEGIDQSGKKTQTILLARRLRRKGLRVSILRFPVYSTASGQQILAFLKGKRNYPFEALHMLYSLNRWENKDTIKAKLKDDRFLIADRYTASNLAYGVARGLSLEWLQTLDEGLPTPDIVIVLDVPVPSSFSRKRTERDLHESNRLLLERVRTTYLRLARRFHWNVIKAAGPPEKVSRDVWRAIETRF